MAKPDITHLAVCAEDARIAALDQDRGPADPETLAEVRQRLAGGRDKIASIWTGAAYDPFLARLEELGPRGFDDILRKDPARDGAAGLMLDIAQGLLQRVDGYEAVTRQAFQEVVADLYDGFLSAEGRVGVDPPANAALPPMVKFGNPEAGPYTWPLPQARYFNLQVGVVNLPPANVRRGILAWPALGHETAGHDVLNAYDGLLEEVSGAVRTALSGERKTQALASYWADRIDETASDVLGILNMGPAAAIGLIGYFRGLNAANSGTATLRNTGSARDPHPADIVRGFLAAETVRQLRFAGAGAWADVLDAETVKDVRAITLAGIPVSVDVARESARLVARAITGQPLASLKNHSFSQIQNWSDGDEELVDRLRASLRSAAPIANLRDEVSAAHLVSATALSAIAGSDAIPVLFQRMVQLLDQVHDVNPTFGPLRVMHRGDMVRHHIYVRQPANVEESAIERRPVSVDTAPPAAQPGAVDRFRLRRVALSAQGLSLQPVNNMVAWLRSGGEQRASLPAGSMNPLHDALTAVQGAVPALQLDLARVQDQWTAVTRTEATAVVRVFVDRVLRSLAAALDNANALASRAAVARVRTEEAKGLVGAHAEQARRRFDEARAANSAAIGRREQLAAEIQAANDRANSLAGVGDAIADFFTKGPLGGLMERINALQQQMNEMRAQEAAAGQAAGAARAALEDLELSRELLDRMEPIDGSLAEYQNVLNTAIRTLTKARDDDQAFQEARGEAAAKFFLDRAGRDMDELLLWADAFRSGQEVSRSGFGTPAPRRLGLAESGTPDPEELITHFEKMLVSPDRKEKGPLWQAWHYLQVFSVYGIRLPNTEAQLKLALGIGNPGEFTFFNPMREGYDQLHGASSDFLTNVFGEVVKLGNSLRTFSEQASGGEGMFAEVSKLLDANPADALELLEALQKQATANAEEAGKVGKLLAGYKTKLVEGQATLNTVRKSVEADSKTSQATIDRLKGGEDVAGSIENLKKLLASKQAEYDHDVVVASTTVTYAWVIPPLGLIAAVAVASVYGTAATSALEELQKERDKMQKANAELFAALATHEVQEAAERGVTGVLLHLEQAVIHTTTVQNAWNGLARELETVKTNLGFTTTATADGEVLSGRALIKTYLRKAGEAWQRLRAPLAELTDDPFITVPVSTTTYADFAAEVQKKLS